MRNKPGGPAAVQTKPTARSQKSSRVYVAGAETRAERQLSWLARIGSSLADLTREQSLAVIVDAALDGLGWESAAIYLRGADGSLTLSAVCPNDSAPDFAGRSLQSGMSAVERALLSETPILLEPPSEEDSEALGIAGGFGRVILAPIRSDGVPAGILTAATRAGPSPHPGDLSFVSALASEIGGTIVHLDLLASREGTHKALEAVYQVSQRASETTGAMGTLNAALDAIRTVLGITSCAVYEALPSGKRLRCVASLNVPQSFIQAVEEYSPTSPAHEVLATGVAMAYTGPKRYPGDPRVSQTAINVELQSALIVPIYMGGEGYGVLSLYESRLREWNHAELQLAQMLAGIVAGALSRARSYDSLSQGSERLRELHRVSVTLLEMGDLRRVALAATELGRGLLRADVVAIQEYDRRYRLLKLLSAHPPTTESLPSVAPVGRGVSGKALDELRTVVRSVRLTRAGFNGFEVAVPLLSQSGPLGVLVAFRDAGRGTFQSDELQFMELFATITATAMHNAELLGRSEQLGMLTERNRIATEMHDSVGDGLAALLMKAELVQAALDSDPERARREVDWMIASLRHSIVEMRRILRALKPVDLEQMGLLAAIRKVADDYTHNCGIPVVLRSGDALPRLGRQADYVLYRAVNESLNNVRKYAGATAVTVTLKTYQRQFTLVVEDNGRGFDPAELDSGQGLGLRGLMDSITVAGGSLDIASAPGKGTRITVSFPLPGV